MFMAVVAASQSALGALARRPNETALAGLCDCWSLLYHPGSSTRYHIGACCGHAPLEIPEQTETILAVLLPGSRDDSMCAMHVVTVPQI